MIKRHLLCLSIIFSCLLLADVGKAQSAAAYPLKGKTVAVYFSKKQFNFDDNYRIPLSQFIRTTEGRDAEIEDIKVQTLVALGAMFSKQLKLPIQADSVYFLNEFPELAGKFMANYQSDDHSLQPILNGFEKTDYILVVNPMILGAYKTSSVYSRSNRIITEQIVVKTARIRFELFSPQNGNRYHVSEACVDDRKTKVPESYFEFNMEFSATGAFLSKLFSMAVFNLNNEILSNCIEDN